MTRINLLPWREDRRNRRKREFFMTLVAAGVIGLLVVIVWALVMGSRVETQQGRNGYLTDQITQLDAKIVQIKDLEKTRDRLLARKKIIEQLQANRSQMVHLFDTLVKTIPDSVRLTGLTQTGKKLHLEGVAQSNASVATYMRHLEDSKWLGHHADLKKTENTGGDSALPYEFALDMEMSKPSGDDDTTEDAATSPVAGQMLPATAATAAAASAPAMTTSAVTTLPTGVASAGARPAPATTGSAAKAKGGTP